MRGPIPRPPIERLLARVEIDERGCWIWTGGTSTGYGILCTGSNYDGSRRPVRAHVIAYEALVGPIPDGYDVHHNCGHRRCVNPDHLEAIAHGEHTLKHGRNVRA